MKFAVDVCKFTEDFVNDYPKQQYPELMYKLGRPYTCLILDVCDDYYICIPFRSHINHKNAFLFHETKRSLQTHSGLDYTKIILFRKNEYISKDNVVVDQDEYKEMIKNANQIVTEVCKYINDYVNHITKTKIMHPKEFERRYKYTTLMYFHEILLNV